MSGGYMLDTNTVSYLMRNHAVVLNHLLAVPVGQVCISAITEGELLYGLAKRPSQSRTRAVQALLTRIEVRPWNSDVAEQYGILRAELEAGGRVLAPLDMQIAAHAVAENCVLVTADKAFTQVSRLTVVDWTH